MPLSRTEILEHFAPLSEYGDSIQEMAKALEESGYPHLNDDQLLALLDAVQRTDELLLGYVGPADEGAGGEGGCGADEEESE